MPAHIFDLYVPAYDVLRYYEGRVKSVRVRDNQGQVVEFLLEHVLKFSTKAGISGTFVLYTDAFHRFAGIDKLA